MLLYDVFTFVLLKFLQPSTFFHPIFILSVQLRRVLQQSDEHLSSTQGFFIVNTDTFSYSFQPHGKTNESSSFCSYLPAFASFKLMENIIYVHWNSLYQGDLLILLLLLSLCTKSFYTSILMTAAWRNISNSSASSTSFFQFCSLLLVQRCCSFFRVFFLFFGVSSFPFDQSVQSSFSSFPLSWWSKRSLNLIFPCSS